MKIIGTCQKQVVKFRILFLKKLSMRLRYCICFLINSIENNFSVHGIH